MKKVLLLLANGFEAYEASVFTDVLGWNEYEGDGTTQIVTCGMHKQLKSTWGFTVIPEIQVNTVDVSNYVALAIPGGFEEAGFYQDAYHEEFLSLIRQFDEAGKYIATICVGALPVGKSGVLTRRKGTTYHLNNQLRQKQLASYGVDIVNQPVVVDGNIITSSCPATALDVAFILLERLTSVENCQRVKSLMGFQDIE
ncbi:DJ-1/PfpI family protein [Sporomusa malonica]|uniref:4-methyl-5(B-hydroxyethyl)-thiazole monophosphate biosynthesis n=1 Tax=Sporomusa malonica TaxID=112901 RepID=A0A1W1ZLQ9_9FIRM|nr:DJ-1/PfpI family protein [Sporomusa malonica]SMC49183.1 4-methyl-5(b-hydroxyethyl)-thiazole monophosphate biosynthesis [Sporomusa malonica]